MQLFSPILLGTAWLPNRIGCRIAPRSFLHDTGCMSADIVPYVAERAPGAGLVILPEVRPAAPPTPHPHLGCYQPSHQQPLRQYCQTIRAAGAVAGLVLDDGMDAVLAMGNWQRALHYATRAGIQLVMLSSTTGGLFARLLARRSTAMDALIAAVEHLRRQAGNQVALGMQLRVGDYGRWSVPLHDARVVARRLAGAGIALLDIVGDESAIRFPGWQVPLAASIRATSDVPVMVGGLLGDPLLAEHVIAGGSADLLVLSQTMHDTPTWPHHARAILSTRPALPGLEPERIPRFS